MAYLTNTVPGATTPVPLEWLELDADIPTDVATLCALLFGPGSEFKARDFAQAKFTDIKFGPWENNCRTVSYTMPKSALIKLTPASETQECIVCDPNHAYTIMCTQTAPNLPFGRDFVSKIQFCMTKKGPHTANLRISFQIDFSKFTIAKSMIRTKAKKGSREKYIALQRALLIFLDAPVPADLPQPTSVASAADADNDEDIDDLAGADATIENTKAAEKQEQQN